MMALSLGSMPRSPSAEMARPRMPDSTNSLLPSRLVVMPAASSCAAAASSWAGVAPGSTSSVDCLPAYCDTMKSVMSSTMSTVPTSSLWVALSGPSCFWMVASVRLRNSIAAASMPPCPSRPSRPGNRGRSIDPHDTGSWSHSDPAEIALEMRVPRRIRRASPEEASPVAANARRHPRPREHHRGGQGDA